MNDAMTNPDNSADTYADVRSAASRNRSVAGVIMHANIEGESDFASENRALALRLYQHHFPIQIAPTGGQNPDMQGRNLRANRRDFQNLQHDRLDLAESVLYQSGNPTTWNLDFYGRCRIGRAAFGTDRITDGWAERCNALDELWLPSEFHRETFAASGVDRSKTRIIPHAFDTQMFHPGRSPLRLSSVPSRSFQFMAIADGWFASGIDILLRAFVEEFAPDEDVALVLYCPPERCGDSYIDFESEVISLIESELDRKLEDVPTIAILTGSISDEDRAGFFAASHAFVRPSRADATGQHCIEALACQLPVIATDWGSLHDLLTDENSFPLATNGVVLARPEEDELVAGHRWAEPNLDHLRHRLREVFTAPKEAARRAEQGRREVIDRFEWNAVLPEWMRNFRRLLD
ncbi:MAG TPA: glycosyltransferase [Candidatus Acidoferrum sp.]|jgi:glycosyltransferase involved in cell wall biosynthesis